MNIKNDSLMKANFPEVTDIRVPLDNYDTLLSNKRAKELLDWEPLYNRISFLPVSKYSFASVITS